MEYLVVLNIREKILWCRPFWVIEVTEMQRKALGNNSLQFYLCFVNLLKGYLCYIFMVFIFSCNFFLWYSIPSGFFIGSAFETIFHFLYP